jgi:hypothetical protein
VTALELNYHLRCFVAEKDVLSAEEQKNDDDVSDWAAFGSRSVDRCESSTSCNNCQQRLELVSAFDTCLDCLTHFYCKIRFSSESNQFPDFSIRMDPDHPIDFLAPCQPNKPCVVYGCESHQQVSKFCLSCFLTLYEDLKFTVTYSPSASMKANFSQHLLSFTYLNFMNRKRKAEEALEEKKEKNETNKKSRKKRRVNFE